MRPRDVSLHLLDEIPSLQHEQQYSRERRRPDTAMQAMLEAAPGVEPAESAEDMQAFTDAVQDCIAMLPQRDQDMIHEMFYRAYSQRSAGQVLGFTKSTAHRIANSVPEKIRPLLASHPLIRERLGMTPTWNFACWTIVKRLYDRWDSLVMRDPDPSLDAIDDAIDTYQTWGPTTRPWMRDEEVIHFLDVAALGAMWEATAFDNWEWPSIEDMVAMLASKHHDYGTDAITRFGLNGILIRLSDKLARWKQLTSLQESDTVACEPLTDTLLDIFGYVVIANMLDGGSFCYELAVDPQVGIAA